MESQDFDYFRRVVFPICRKNQDIVDQAGHDPPHVTSVTKI